jgi:hypothetical protein
MERRATELPMGAADVLSVGVSDGVVLMTWLNQNAVAILGTAAVALSGG